MASGRVERIKEMRNQIPGHRLRYYADAVDAGLSIEDVKAGRVETWMGVAKADLLRERDEARAERDDAKEWVHHATRMANERDEARADRDALAKALRDMLDLHDPDGEWRREHDENSDGHWPYQSGSDALAAALRMTVFSNGENSLPEAVAMRLEVAHSVLETYDGRSA